MIEDPFIARLAEAISTSPPDVAAVAFDRSMSRNTAAVMTACLERRLAASGAGTGKLRNTTYSWNGGLLNIRNAVNADLWTNLRISVAERLHHEAAQRPVAFVMCRWTPGDPAFDVWLIPEALMHEVLPKLPVEQTPGKKTVRIKPGQHRFMGLDDSPSLEPFYVRVPLADAESSLLAEADRIDGALRKARKEGGQVGGTAEVEEPAGEATPSPAGRSDGPSGFWWVNQGQTFAAERRLGVIWAPQRNEKGTAFFHWTNVSRVRAGDLVFSYAGGAIRSVSVARTDGHAGQQPPELAGNVWGKEGWTAEVEYYDLVSPVVLAAIAPELGALGLRRGPLNTVGGVNQAYLFELTPDAARVIASKLDLAALPDAIASKLRDGDPRDPGVPGPPPLPPVPQEPYTVERATEGLFLPRAEVVSLLADWRRKKNLILQGPPGVGKTFVARRLAYALMGVKDPARLEMVQFHQSYAYEDFVQGWRPQESGGFRRRNGVFHEFCRRASADAAGRPHVFIIDEINRGNVSRIFGELMYLLEPDHRGEAHAIPLTYSESADERFFVPANVHVLGMMNTADRSLAMVDYALRRRFAFTQLRPAFAGDAFRTFLAGRGATDDLVAHLVSRISSLNERIREDRNLGRGFEIGHSFFCPADGEAPDDAWYGSVVAREVAPLVREYWFDDLEAAEELIAGLGR